MLAGQVFSANLGIEFAVFVMLRFLEPLVRFFVMRQWKLVSFVAAAAITTAAFAGAPKKSQALMDKGKAAYTTNCVTCHGEKGDGNGPAGSALNPKPRNFISDKYKAGDKVEQVFDSITKGLPGTAMVGFSSIPEEDRWGIAYYVLAFKKK